MAKINWVSIHQQVAIHKGARKKAHDIAEKTLISAHKSLLKDFDNHVVTREIKEGPEGSNLSGTLGGYGNLFSFIGFFEEDKPTELIRNILESDGFAQISELSTGASFVKGGLIEFKFRINYLGLDEIANNFSYPHQWDNGPWLKDIETGIRGLNYYLFDDFSGYSRSRSTTGLQAKSGDGELVVIRGEAVSNPISYISELLKLFQGRLA